VYFLQDPPIRELEEFTRLPDRFRRTEVTSWAIANRGGSPTDSFLEGPVADDEGNLYVTDIPYGRIFRVDPSGAWLLVAEYDGEPNGMKLMGRGELLVSDYRKGLVAVDIASGRTGEYLRRRNSEAFKGLNDLVFDSKGNLYFTDQGQTGLHDPTGRVFRLGTDGRLDLLLSNAPAPTALSCPPTRDSSSWP
jgi:gluconolactonase